MKKTLIILFFVLFSSHTYSNVVSLDEVVEREGLFYKKFSTKLFTGKVEDYYEDGQLDIEGEVLLGKRTGTWKKYNSGGTLSRKEKYEDGIMVQHQFFRPNKTMFLSNNYNKGKPHGVQEGYHRNGQLDYRKHYNEGELHGLSVSFYENGQLEYRRNYNGGEPMGVWEVYTKTGEDVSNKPHFEMYDLGEDTPHWFMFVGKYKDGKREGTWTDFKTGNVIDTKSNYKNNKLHGLRESWKTFFPSKGVGYSLTRSCFQEGKEVSMKYCPETEWKYSEDPTPLDQTDSPPIRIVNP